MKCSIPSRWTFSWRVARPWCRARPYPNHRPGRCSRWDSSASAASASANARGPARSGCGRCLISAPHPFRVELAHLQLVSATVAGGATSAFSRRPLSRAFRLFIGLLLKGSKGSTGGFQRATIVAAAACVNSSSAVLKAATAPRASPRTFSEPAPWPRTSWQMPDIHERIAERFAVRIPSALARNWRNFHGLARRSGARRLEAAAVGDCRAVRLHSNLTGWS